MSLFNRIFVICIAAMCTAGLVSAAFAQTSDTASGNERGNMQRTADLVNLMRTILDPNPAPVLASPAERAVSGKTTADPASPVATTVPVVTMPDIEPPEEESGEPDKVDTGTGKPAQSAVAASASKKDADETDPAPYPPFYYVFFYGEYVPFFVGIEIPTAGFLNSFYAELEYISNRDELQADADEIAWTVSLIKKIGKRSKIQLSAYSEKEPVVPERHRIPRKNETGGEPLPKNSNIPVAPSQHRFPSKAANQIDFPEKNDKIPVAPGQHRIPSRAARQNSAPQNSSNIPVAPGAHRIPRSNR